MRLIDVDALIAEYDRQHEGTPGRARKLMEEAPTIDPEPQWIPVTERLPGIGEPVLDESLSVNWMSYASGGKEWIFPRDVKAWIPLPGEPYKEVTE